MTPADFYFVLVSSRFFHVDKAAYTSRENISFWPELSHLRTKRSWCRGNSASLLPAQRSHSPQIGSARSAGHCRGLWRSYFRSTSRHEDIPDLSSWIAVSTRGNTMFPFTIKSVSGRDRILVPSQTPLVESHWLSLGFRGSPLISIAFPHNPVNPRWISVESRDFPRGNYDILRQNHHLICKW